MDKKTRDFLIALVSTTLKVDTKAAEALLFEGPEDAQTLREGAATEVVGKITAHIEGINTAADKRLSNLLLKNKKETLDALEASVRAEFEIDSDAKGIDLIKEVVTSKTKPADLTEEAIKATPTYTKMVNRLTLEKDNAVKEEQGKIAKNEEKQSLRSLVKKKLDALEPKLSENPVVAETHVNTYLSKIEELNYKTQRNAAQELEFILLDKDGNPLTDNIGHPVTLDEWVKDTASKHFDLPKAEERSSSSDPAKKAGESGASGGGAWNPQKPADANGVAKLMDEVRADKSIDEAERTKRLDKVSTFL